MGQNYDISLVNSPRAACYCFVHSKNSLGVYSGNVLRTENGRLLMFWGRFSKPLNLIPTIKCRLMIIIEMEFILLNLKRYQQFAL